MNRAKVEIYTWASDPHCQRAKDLLVRKGIPFDEYMIEGDNEALMQMSVRAGGSKSVPQIFIDDRHVGGADDLYDLEEAGKLDRLLMGSILDVALLQMCSGPDIEANMEAVETMIRRAAGDGAQFILTPENTCHMRYPATRKLESSPVESMHPMLFRIATLAQELQVSILLGSISVKVSETRVQNRSYIFDTSGNIVAKYNKIHLFDAAPGNERYTESMLVQSGNKAVIADMDFGKVGMTVCYDLRFPYLYRMLAKAGTYILTVPSAFTAITGQAHWETLLRARAIETGCFVLAPAQTGEHEGGRKSWGHSMVVNPWGTVVARAGGGPGILKAQIDLSEVDDVRRSIPALMHDRAVDF
jgi:GrxC family glutaredoxin